MTRQAIIIECSAIAGQDPLPGAAADAELWHAYLQSSRAGAWRPSEITILKNPRPSVARDQIARMNVDYGFVTFSGHGYVSKTTDATMLCLQGGDLSEWDLTPHCARATLIMDSCRGVYDEKMLKAEVALSEFAEPELDGITARRLFNLFLEQAERGSCTLYGCAFDQAAQEEPNAGGLFTQALIQTGAGWSQSGALSLRRVFDAAESIVKQKHPQQTPEARLGRRLHHFPFAVNNLDNR